MKKVIHIINNLQPSGAEQMLFRLISNFEERYDLRTEIIVLRNNNDEEFVKEFTNLGIKISFLEATNSLMRIQKLNKILRLAKPDIVQTWMYEADIIGGIAAKLANIKTIIWNVRSVRPAYHNLTYLKAVGLLSWIIPKKIISNSQRAINFKSKHLYNRRKFVYIPNGYDLSSASIENSFISKSNDEIVFGNVSRFDKTKGLNILLDAIASLQKSNVFPNFKFFGTHMTLKNKNLKKMIEKRNINLTNIKFYGFEKSKDAIFNSFDILCQSSNIESFPNVIMEAAMYGKVILSTKTGDLEDILEKTNYLVDINSSEQISKTIKSILNTSNETLEKITKNNLQLVKKYNIDIITDQYYEFYININ